MITAFASIESAVAAVKEGAFDYLPKTFSVDQLRVAVERAVRHRSLQVENRNLRAQLQETLGLDNIIGHSPAMTQVFELVKKAARSEANILVLGESGTGKELIARAIHANSPRAAAPSCRRSRAARAAPRIGAIRHERRVHGRRPDEAGADRGRNARCSSMRSRSCRRRFRSSCCARCRSGRSDGAYVDGRRGRALRSATNHDSRRHGGDSSARSSTIA
jgi:hypothetical protein